jgi:hypothetical protein
LPKVKWNIKVAIALNSISLILVVNESLIRPTILGNVIFLGSAILLSFIAALFLIGDIFKNRNKINITFMSISLLLVAYVIIMFVTGNVPAGYGP